MTNPQVPGATRTLNTLRELASHGPMQAAVLARNLNLPRSSMYHLLKAMQDQGFVTYYPEDRTWGLGVSVFEIGSAYLRHEPMERLVRPLLANLVSPKKFPLVAHLGILQGNETMYLLKETASQPMTLVTDVGIRLPAQLTATGRAILAQLPEAQVRAIFPNNSSFTSRTGIGPSSFAELKEVLKSERTVGFAKEVGAITAGYQSVAMALVDRSNRPVAAIGLTYKSTDADQEVKLLAELKKVAKELTRRLH